MTTPRALFVLLIATLLFVPVMAQNNDNIGETRHSIYPHNGIFYPYILHVPPSPVDETLPLLLVLHGRNMTGEQMQAITQFDRLADEEGFIVVYPDGVIDAQWNFTADIPFFEPGADDIGFLLSLVGFVADTQPVDLSRVYVVGFSNGGYMAQRLACTAPNTFAAFATVAAGGFIGLNTVCEERGTAPMLLIHGTEDRVVPWDGLREQFGDEIVERYWGISSTTAFWMTHNGCDLDAAAFERLEKLSQDPTEIFRMTTDCPSNTDVVLYGIINGGHNWAGTNPARLNAEIAGVVSTEINASDAVWAFVSQYALPNS